MADGASPGPIRRFYRVFRWVVLAVMVVVILLVLKKSPPPVVQSDPAAKQRLQAKLEALDKARSAGEPHALKMEEAELNSWLGSNLALAPMAAETATAPTSPPAPTTEPTIEEVRSTVRDVKLDLLEDSLRAYVLFNFHGQDLSLLLEGRLRVEAGYLRFDPTGGKLGSLPLPQATLDSAVRRLFDSPENRHKFHLPAEIKDIGVRNGELVVSYR